MKIVQHLLLLMMIICSTGNSYRQSTQIKLPIGKNILIDGKIQINEWTDAKIIRVYAIDDNTAIKVINGSVEIISEGKWKLFNS